MLASRRFLAALSLVVVAAGCYSKPSTPPAAPAAPAPKLTDLPFQFTVMQRSTHTFEEFDGALKFTIDDITRGQVMVSLADNDGRAVLAPTSLAEGEKATFKFGDGTYVVELVELDNELIGGDDATFAVFDASETAPPYHPIVVREENDNTKIDKLIEHVGSLEDATFIRNGQEHTPAQAAQHLRTKWQAAPDIATAEQFIDAIASKSSTTGEPYRIRLADGTEQPAGEYLRQRLAELK
jgi:hypothetical protein